MKNIFNQIETMGLTTIKEFTGINAANVGMTATETICSSATFRI